MPTNDNRFGGRRASLLTTSTLQLGSVLERQSGGYRYRLNWSGAPTVRRRKAASKKGTVYVRKGLLPSAAAASLILAGAATLTALPPGAHAGTPAAPAGGGTITYNTGSDTASGGGTGQGVLITPAGSETITVNGVDIVNTAGTPQEEALRIGATATPGGGTGNLILDVTGLNTLTADAGDFGPLVISEDGAITLVSSGTTHYNGTYGVDAYSTTSGVVSMTLGANDVIDVGTTGGNTQIGSVTGAVGIIGESLGGGVTINNAAKITGTALAQGIYAADSGTGAVSIGNTSANTITATNFGLYATSAGGGTTITNSGAISVTGSGSGPAGIYGGDTSGGAVHVTTSGGGTISGGDYGVQAIGSGTGSGTVTVSVGAGISGAAVDGVDAEARSGDNGTITVNANADVTSSGGDGIYAHGAGSGGVTVNVDNGATATGANGHSGVDAVSAGSGQVVVNVGATSGSTVVGGVPIMAQAATGGVIVHTYAGSSLLPQFNGGGEGIVAEETGASGNVQVINGASVGTSGSNNGYGIFAAVDPGGAGTVTVSNTGVVYASGGYGIYAVNNGSGSVSIDSSGAVHNVGSGTAISGETASATAAVNIGTNGGLSGNIDAPSNAAITGAKGVITINTGSATVSGSNGIFTNSQSSTGPSITVGNGTAGSVTGTGAYGILDNSTGTGGATVTVEAGATVSGPTNAIDLTNTHGNTVNADVTATLTNGVAAAGAGNLFKVSGTGASYTNAPVLTGTWTVEDAASNTLTLANANLAGHAFQVDAGKTLSASPTDLGSGNVTLLAGSTIKLNGAYSNNFSGTGDPIYDVSGGDSSDSGVISGTGDVVVTGGHTLTLSGANTYSGGTVLENGTTLAVSSPGNLGIPVAGDVTTDGNAADINFSATGAESTLKIDTTSGAFSSAQTVNIAASSNGDIDVAGANGATLSASLSYDLSKRVSFFGRYDGAYGDLATNHAVSVGFNMTW